MPDHQDIPVLRDILFRMTAQYLTVRPHGFELPEGRMERQIDCRILAYGGARTLYRGRRPACRSLDGHQSLEGDACADCFERKHCVPQVRLDLLYQGAPYRLLLAYSSARNFLVYSQARPGDRLEKIVTRIAVTNRGTWGELRFSEPPSQSAQR